MAELVYPDELLPKLYFRDNPKIDLAKIYRGGCHYTQRRAACEESRCTDDQGEVTFAAMYDTLREDSKRGDELIGFSVNMMGTPHLSEYGKWLQKNPGSKYWDGKDVDIKNYVGAYEFRENQAFVYLDAEAIESAKIPYEIQFADRDAYEKYGMVPGIYEKDFSRSSRYSVEGIVRHFHAPTFLNYWHAEIWVTHPENDIKSKNLKEKPEWKKVLQRKFLELLRASATTKMNRCDEIPPSAYLIGPRPPLQG